MVMRILAWKSPIFRAIFFHAAHSSRSPVFFTAGGSTIPGKPAGNELSNESAEA
jgi:hypothetical protein